MAKYIIDITRFLSRIGFGRPTGIDRVEHKYITELIARDPDLLAVGKMGGEYIVLTGGVLAPVLAGFETAGFFGRACLKDRVRFKIPVQQRESRTYFRNRALNVARSVKEALTGLDLGGAEYVNVGHSNLTVQMMTALGELGCAGISVMIHDMIPLDHPEYTRAGISEQFERRMRIVARYADRVICNSNHTKERVSWYFEKWGYHANTVVAHLGIQGMGTVEKLIPAPPYFVVLGTIEPRKNHELLFAVWTKLAKTMPEGQVPLLHVVGRRGWDNQTVLDFMDSSPLMGKMIFEHADLDDDKMFSLLAQSAGLLFPSHAEGYGLPALEAAQLGVPVLCSDLDVFHELMGDYAVYLDVNDPDKWGAAIMNAAQNGADYTNCRQLNVNTPTIPQWNSHFRHVFGNTEDRQSFDE